MKTSPHLRPPVEKPRRTEARRSTDRTALPKALLEEPIYLRVLGRIYKVMPRALRSYVEEYGFSLETPFDFEQCMTHIAAELTEALQGEAKPIGRRGRMFRHDSSSLIFKLIGSKVVGIRISLKYNPRQDVREAEELCAAGN